MHLVLFFFFGACQCFVKSESPNLHRHQKKQTTRCTKPAQAPKKTKKLKFPGTMGPLLSSCWNFCFFFVFFGACRCLVHLVVCFFLPVNVLWSQSHQTCTGTKKKQKKQTTRCTKPAQAPKKTKNLKFPGTATSESCQCFVKSESPNLHRHQKKQKNTNH